MRPSANEDWHDGGQAEGCRQAGADRRANPYLGPHNPVRATVALVDGRILGFAPWNLAMCSIWFLTRRTLPSRNLSTTNGCVEIALGTSDCDVVRMRYRWRLC